MTRKLVEWASEHGQITKITPSDARGRNAVLLAVERCYDFHEFECHLGNVGYGRFGLEFVGECAQL